MSQHASPIPSESMAQVYTITPDDAAWDAFVDGSPHAHLLQTSAWAALKSQFGWTSTRVALTAENGVILAGASILFRTVLGMKLAYVPRGPLTEWSDPPLTMALLDAIATVSRQRGAFLLIVEPGLPDSAENQLLMQRYGFTRSPHNVQPRSTIMVDISLPEDEILARMKSKWRYNVRLSARRDIVVREAALSDMDAFNELMATTGQRDGFAVHEAAYYAAAYRLLATGSRRILDSRVRRRAARRHRRGYHGGHSHLPLGRQLRSRTEPDAKSRAAMGGHAMGEVARRYVVRPLGYP